MPNIPTYINMIYIYIEGWSGFLFLPLHVAVVVKLLLSSVIRIISHWLDALSDYLTLMYVYLMYVCMFVCTYFTKICLRSFNRFFMGSITIWFNSFVDLMEFLDNFSILLSLCLIIQLVEFLVWAISRMLINWRHLQGLSFNFLFFIALCVTGNLSIFKFGLKRFRLDLGSTEKGKPLWKGLKA